PESAAVAAYQSHLRAVDQARCGSSSKYSRSLCNGVTLATVAGGSADKGVIVFDLKITGGTVVDGTGADRFDADIAVKAANIVEIRRRGAGSPPLEGDAAENIDATGKIVAPGFVDIHTHYDGQGSWVAGR